MLNKLLKTIAPTLIVVVFTIECVAFAQQRTSTENDRLLCSNQELRQSSCESTKQILDLALVKAQETNNALLTVIIRLGNKEKSKTLVLKRKDFIRNYLLLTKAGAIEKENLTFQEGRKTDKLGKVEIYVNNNFIGEILYSTNAKNSCKNETD